jgi:hypothetical protein
VAARGPGAASSVAFGGIAAALCLLFLSAVRLVPTADLVFLSLTSLVVAATVIEKGVRTAALVWLAASVLSFVFPGFPTSLAFVVLFGPYPLSKAWIESRKGLRALPAWLLKFLAFDLVFVPVGLLVLGPLAGTFGTTAFLDLWAGRLWSGAPVILLVLVAAQVAFAVYELALSLMISFYLRRIRPSLVR